MESPDSDLQARLGTTLCVNPVCGALGREKKDKQCSRALPRELLAFMPW